jgi:hypothetical protein
VLSAEEARGGALEAKQVLFCAAAAAMPASKQRSQSPAGGRDATPAAARGARSPSPALIKARHSRYKEVSGSAPWLPDLQGACELAAVTFLLLPGLFMGAFVEAPWVQAALQRFCVFMTGACILGRFLFAVPLPKCSVSVTQDKNDRLVVHEHESTPQLETALELAMPEVSGDKSNSAYYVNSPGKGVKGLWHQPERNQAPLFVPCAELLADDAEQYTVEADEAKQVETELFATNPAVQQSNLESKLKKQWAAAAGQVEKIVFIMYGLLGFSALRPSQGFDALSFLAIILVVAFAGFLHTRGLGLNDQAVNLSLGGVEISLPAAVWKRDLNARKSVRQPAIQSAIASFTVRGAELCRAPRVGSQGQAAVVSTLKGMGGALRSAALGIAGVATVVRPLFVLQELRELAEWLPKDLVLIAFELSVELAQHIFRLMYRFVLYPALMRESAFTLQLKDQGPEMLRLCVELSGTELEFWRDKPEVRATCHVKSMLNCSLARQC